MHTLTLLLVLIPLFFTQTAYSHTPHTQIEHQSSQLDPIDVAALQTFGNTVQCMFNIVENPDDRKNVLNNVGTIVSGIINFIIHATNNHKKNTDSVIDATHEINELCTEQFILTHNIHTMLDSIGKVIESLGDLMHEQCDAHNVGKTINQLMEKIVTIAVAIMKNHYLQGHATEDDFESYLRNLEELQEQIRHSIITNALYLRDKKKE